MVNTKSFKIGHILPLLDTMEESDAHIRLRSIGGYRFEVDFGREGVEWLFTDEPAPMGEGMGPDPGDLLGAAVGNCLSASMLFCLRKMRVELEALETDVTVEYRRNEAGKLRIPRIRVTLRPAVGDEDAKKLEKCREMFETFCIVGESVRSGIDVQIDVQ